MAQIFADYEYFCRKDIKYEAEKVSFIIDFIWLSIEELSEEQKAVTYK